MDWQAWLDRWDAQQTAYVPDREERFGVIADVVTAAAGDRPRVLDLGTGPGSLSARLLDRLPAADVTAVDADPVLLTLGRRAATRSLTWADRDLRRDDWSAGLPGPYDAAVSTTALHWLPADRLPGFYAELRTLLRPGGVFVDGDHFADEPGSTLAGLAAAMRRDEPTTGPWDSWWAEIEREPELAGAFAERTRRQHEHPRTVESGLLSTHLDALRAAGFAEAGTVWQHGTDRVLVAVR